MKKVLIIEDDVDILEALRLTLEVNGYEVLTAVRGDEGVSKVNQHNPDLIILDYFLAGSNGATLCKCFKQSAHTKHIPVVMTSAHPSAHKAGIENGADAFIAKPFSIGEFMDKVSQSLNVPRLHKNGDNGSNGNHYS